MEKFKVGVTYMTRSIGDHNCIISATISKRTAKTITVHGLNRGTQTFRVSPDYNGDESFKPWGSFSMAPTLSAAETKVLRRDWEQVAAQPLAD